jgi:acylphosphatase
VALVQRRVLISGQVQGVFFRHTTRRRARELSLAGWVRNRLDGRVEAVFRGPPDAVDEMVTWCHRGPPGARVDSVEVVDEAAVEQFPGFSVRPTA